MRAASFSLVLALLCASTCVAFASTDSAVPLEAKGDASKKHGPSAAQIRQILIDESIAAYSGNCPCPYNRASNGSRCGRRSAYSRVGGEAPLCYPKDVSAQMVQDYRDAHADE